VERNEQAKKTALTIYTNYCRAPEAELPPILLTPLRWLEQDQPTFYKDYAVPLLARYQI